MERVVLVDDEGRRTGTEEKLQAHSNGGQLHLAFCVFVFGAGGQVLLQRRALTKYHFAGLWSNACCGHPRPGEGVRRAAERRLGEEFGFRLPLCAAGRYIYRAEDPASGLVEHELAHVLVGHAEVIEPHPDPQEIGAWEWRPVTDLSAVVALHPQRYTPWFRLMVNRFPLRSWASGALTAVN